MKRFPILILMSFAVCCSVLNVNTTHAQDSDSSELNAADARLKQVMDQLQEPASSADPALKKELRKALEDSFNRRLESHEDNLAILQSNVEAMKKQLAARRSSAKEIVKLREQMALRITEAGEWNNRVEIERLWELIPTPKEVIPPATIPDGPIQAVDDDRPRHDGESSDAIEASRKQASSHRDGRDEPKQESLTKRMGAENLRIARIDAILSLKPRDSGREDLIGTVAKADYPKCKVSKTSYKNGGKGWVLYDPLGKKLVELIDSNKDDIVDTWIYFNSGREIVREYQPKSIGGKEVSVSEPAQILIDKQKAIEEGYVVGVNDLVGVFVDGVIGTNAPPVSKTYRWRKTPLVGFPFIVEDGGLLALPLIKPINVGGKTVAESRQAIVDAYTGGESPLAKKGTKIHFCVHTKNENLRTPIRFDTGDVIGVYIDGVLGKTNIDPPLNEQSKGTFHSFGYPIAVDEDGTISLPQIDPIDVRQKTIGEIRKAITKAYTKGIPIVGPEARIMVSFMYWRPKRQTFRSRN